MASSIEEMSTRFDTLAAKFDSFQEMMRESLDKWSGLEAWRLSADEAFGTLLQKSTAMADQLGAATSRIDQLELRSAPPPPPPPPPPVLRVPPHARPPPHPETLDLNLAPMTSPPAQEVEGVRPSGHPHGMDHRVFGGGIVGSSPHPVTGTLSGSDFHPRDSEFGSSLRPPPFPKLEFPKFHGDNPRLWRDQCLLYFEVYGVHESLKTRFAALNFKGSAATWLQTVEKKGRINDWSVLCRKVFEHFDRDQYPKLIKKFDMMTQQGSVAEYHEEFVKMMHALLLYNSDYDDTFFVTRFVAGLKQEIRAVISLHRPRDVVEASTLALMQEEELASVKERSGNRDFHRNHTRHQPDRGKIGDADKPKQVSVRQDSGDKWSSLKETRRRNGLCYVCGEKWSPNHTCPAKVSLHVVEESLSAMNHSDSETWHSDTEEQEDIISVVTQKQASSDQRRRTMKMCGRIGKAEILILVDSGSVATFVSTRLVDRLQLNTVTAQSTQFITADGSPMTCSLRTPDLQWSVQNQCFISDAGVLPLKCFDLILGQDWLEECSPMWVDWARKVMKFTHRGRRITLRGLHHSRPVCSAVSVQHMQQLIAAHKIKAIKVRFAAIVKQRTDVNTLVSNFPRDQHVGTRHRTVGEMSWLSKVPESKIPLRDQEKDEIISELVECNAGENNMIVSIVGLGGSGKTTLAKHICHDVKIKEHFGNEIFWVHVSQEFDVEKLIGKLFQKIVGDNSDCHPPEHMVQKISEKLSNKKFLLILDDAWHEDRHDWEQFMVQLKCGAPETRIILTTRDRKVAEAVESRHIFELAFLSESESWNLFLKGSGLLEQDLSSDHVQVGKEIIKGCGGVPLAIQTLGAVLRDKKHISTWRAIRDNNLWNVQSINDKVFASLKLSYIHLADELKQCFTFCSIFPKGYGIQKDRLIAQWIAHGFINAMNGEQPEDIGRDYFDSLVKLRFLQQAYQIWNNVIYNMHDLIHDLTRQILEGELVTCVPIHTTEKFSHRYRYLSLTSFTENVDKGLFDKVRALYISESNPSFDTTVKNSCCMRSVVLDYTVDTPFSLFILKFEYLGYLEIHNVSCTTVPEAISRCWNLQSLHFDSCSGFMTLPESVGKLRKLRTLELCCITDLESLPQSIGDFYVLQSLQLYNCSKLREIPSSLGQIGNLCVLDIEYCSSLQQLPSDITGEFKNLRTINFNGCTGLQDLPSTLSCPTLHTLNLSETKVTMLPQWVTSIDTLECIDLVGCKQDLPSTLSCPTLRTLNLSRTKVTMLPQWITSIDTLECIDLEDCRELRELPKGIANLKRLAVLNIGNCSALCCLPSGLGQLTRLRKLELFVVGCGADDARISELENLDMIGGRLEITNLNYLTNPSDAEKACLKRKSNIEILELKWSLSDTEEDLVSEIEHDWRVLNALEPPSQIEGLKICGYRGPCLPGWMTKQNDPSYCEGGITIASHFLCLSWLTLERFPNLRHMRGFVELPSLYALVLDEMPNLEELWTAQCPFPVLSNLRIRGCPKLNGSPCFPPSLLYMSLERSNGQLLSTGRFSHQLPSMHALVPHLKILVLRDVTGSSYGWELLQHLTKLKELSIYRCNDLTQLPESMRNLTSLEFLHIKECPAVGTLPDWFGELHSLRRLVLDMGDTKQFPEAIQYLTSLEILNMYSGRALTVLPEWIGQLSALRELYIHDFPALQYLPQSIQSLTALENLRISGCPGLGERYKREAGPDWHLVSHIPYVYI